MCNPAGLHGQACISSNTGVHNSSGQIEFSKWRKLDSRNLGISSSMISVASWTVLKKLQAAGYQAYLVGGCVRDLLLNKVPKDFDVITTARLKQVMRRFQRALIVGRRYPICRVYVNGSMVEVSSFNTLTRHNGWKLVNSESPKGCKAEDYIRWKDCMRRDFTINSLFFDPSGNVIFDYINAMVDLRALKLQTIIPAHLSFKEDEARILRGLRIAARLNLSFGKETEAALYDLSSSILGLNKSRISQEMNYMLSYGAAEPSLLLLKRFKLLDILLPFHAAYLSEQMGNGHDIRSVMLMKLFFNLDQLISCDRPSNDCVWVAIMAFHLAIFCNPQPATVVLTFASLLYLGTWKDSIKFARQNAPAAQKYVPEIIDDFNELSNDEIAESVIHFARKVESSVNVLINKNSLSEAMTRFPDFPHSDLVLVSRKMGERVNSIYDILTRDVTSLKAEKWHAKIDYRLLAGGKVPEVRFVLGKIILNSMVPGASSHTRVTNMEKDGMESTNGLQKLSIPEPACLNKGDSVVMGGNRGTEAAAFNCEVSRDNDRKASRASRKVDDSRVSDEAGKNEKAMGKTRTLLSSLF